MDNGSPKSTMVTIIARLCALMATILFVACRTSEKMELPIDTSSFAKVESVSMNNAHSSDSVFDSAKWQYHDEDNSTYRESLRKAMVNDLRSNHSILNLSYGQVVARLGQPNYMDSSEAFTAIYTLAFGWNASMEYRIMFDSHKVAKSDRILLIDSSGHSSEQSK